MADISRFTGLTLATREELASQTAAFFARGLEGAANTRRAYRSDLDLLRQWLAARGLAELPLSSATLAAYLSEQATRHAWATLSRRLAAIRKWHKLNQHPNPALDDTVQTVLEGIKRTLGTEPGQAPAFEIGEFKEKIRRIPLTPAGLRDRALLLLGFVGAFRRSELVALDVAGIEFTREGAVISYKGSKTNQYGRTEQKALFFSPDPKTCPVRGKTGFFRQWLEIVTYNTKICPLDNPE